MTTVGNELRFMGGSGLYEDEGSLKRMLSPGEESAEGVYRQPVPPVYGRTISSSLLEVGTTASVMSRMEKDQRGQFRSKSIAWKEPMLLLQRISSRRVPGVSVSKPARIYRQQPKGSSQSEFNRPSRWARFWRSLKLDAYGGKQVHAARPEWLNYDAQSYAMNFEKDRETTSYLSHSQQLPKISGPGAREIVTVLLQRSSSANRNAGCILIPKPVFIVTKQETNTPLWKRRSVQAPSSLIVKMTVPSNRKRSTAA